YNIKDLSKRSTDTEEAVKIFKNLRYLSPSGHKQGFSLGLANSCLLSLHTMHRVYHKQKAM
uniref:Uncharacterized protein n=1 Tax=Scophthalmus maximus TaxID=52904 RepID=A0A8D3EGB2_SCOMX